MMKWWMTVSLAIALLVSDAALNDKYIYHKYLLTATPTIIHEKCNMSREDGQTIEVPICWHIYLIYEYIFIWLKYINYDREFDRNIGFLLIEQ